MKHQGDERIINRVRNLIDSPIVPYHDYTTAKAALLRYSRDLAPAYFRRFGNTMSDFFVVMAVLRVDTPSYLEYSSIIE
ncbi:MAG TPA: hypothetical protein VGI33_20270 [Paenibacillus sp.]|jgi:hypothetical protein